MKKWTGNHQNLTANFGRWEARRLLLYVARIQYGKGTASKTFTSFVTIPQFLVKGCSNWHVVRRRNDEKVCTRMRKPRAKVEVDQNWCISIAFLARLRRAGGRPLKSSAQLSSAPLRSAQRSAAPRSFASLGSAPLRFAPLRQPARQPACPPAQMVRV